MKFNQQDRESFVTQSEAKGLSRWADRCFPFATLRASAHSLSMTGPVLVVTFHDRAWGGAKPRGMCSSPLSRPEGTINHLPFCPEAPRASPQLFQHKIGQLSDMRLGRHIHSAVLERLRRHTQLRQLAHLPILPVDDIEELDSIHRIEIRPAHYLGIKQPVAGHASALRSLRVQRMDDHVIV